MQINARYRAGNLENFQRPSRETVLPVAPVVFADDFLGAGAVVIPDAGSAESGVPWAQHIVGAAPPTVGGVADAASGVLRCALTAASQAQTAALSFGDQRAFSVEQNLVFEARVKVSTLPTAVAEAVWGLVGDYNAVPDTIAESIFFTADGGGAIECEVDDDTDNQSAASGITVLATEWHVYRIECINPTDIRFYIDGQRVASSATFTYGATGADAVLQPFFGLYKASGVGVGAIDVDYVRCWQNRS